PAFFVSMTPSTEQNPGPSSWMTNATSTEGAPPVAESPPDPRIVPPDPGVVPPDPVLAFSVALPPLPALGEPRSSPPSGELSRAAVQPDASSKAPIAHVTTKPNLPLDLSRPERSRQGRTQS